MASTETPEAVVAETPPPPAETAVTVEEAPAPPPEGKSAPPPTDYLALAEVVLRFLLFASAAVAVVVMISSKQTTQSGVVKFNYSPAFIYLVAALSVVGLYSIVTTLLSFYALLKPGSFTQILSHLVILDVVLLGVVGAATGSAGAIVYTAWKGNSEVKWAKICGVYDKFCTYAGTSVVVSLFATIVLAILVLLSFYSLSKKIPK